jgi:septal ring-binding cell division protein DamX
MVYVSTVCAVVTLAVMVLTGCSNAQVRRTPVTPRPVPWFCQMNEARDDWQCVQDAEAAAHPRPDRLPNDVIEPEPVAATAVGLTAAGDVSDSDGLAPLATPGDAADTGVLEEAPEVVDDASDVLAMPEDGFAVQLIATASRDKADAFVDAHGLTGTMTLQLAREAEFYYVVLLGAFDTYAQAQAAVDGRPESLAEITPWIRPLLSIQTGLIAARELRADAGG